MIKNAVNRKRLLILLILILISMVALNLFRLYSDTIISDSTDVAKLEFDVEFNGTKINYNDVYKTAVTIRIISQDPSAICYYRQGGDWKRLDSNVSGELVLGFNDSRDYEIQFVMEDAMGYRGSIKNVKFSIDKKLGEIDTSLRNLISNDATDKVVIANRSTIIDLYRLILDLDNIRKTYLEEALVDNLYKLVYRLEELTSQEISGIHRLPMVEVYGENVIDTNIYKGDVLLNVSVPEDVRYDSVLTYVRGEFREIEEGDDGKYSISLQTPGEYSIMFRFKDTNGRLSEILKIEFTINDSLYNFMEQYKAVILRYVEDDSIGSCISLEKLYMGYLNLSNEIKAMLGYSVERDLRGTYENMLRNKGHNNIVKLNDSGDYIEVLGLVSMGFSEFGYLDKDDTISINLKSFKDKSKNDDIFLEYGLSFLVNSSREIYKINDYEDFSVRLFIPQILKNSIEIEAYLTNNAGVAEEVSADVGIYDGGLAINLSLSELGKLSIVGKRATAQTAKLYGVGTWVIAVIVIFAAIVLLYMYFSRRFKPEYGNDMNVSEIIAEQIAIEIVNEQEENNITLDEALNSNDDFEKDKMNIIDSANKEDK